MATCLPTGIFTFHWKITNLRYCRWKNGEPLQSPSFNLPNTTWHLQLYPKGKNVNCVDYISVYLVREEDEGPEFIYIKNKFSDIKGNNATEVSASSFGKGDAKGCDKFLFYDMKSPYKNYLNVKCVIYYNSSVSKLFSSDEDPSWFKSEFQDNTSILNVHATENVEEDKRLCAWPIGSSASSEFSFKRKIIEWPLDDSIVVDGEFKQVIPVVSSQYSPSFIITMKKDGDFLSLEINLGLRNKFGNEKSFANLRLVLSVKNETFVSMPDKEYDFQKEEQNVWCLDKIMKVSKVKSILNIYPPSFIKWRFEFIFINGNVCSEMESETYGKVVS